MKNEVKRHQVAEEVLCTERTYASGLEELQRCFLTPLTALESILPELSKLTAEVQVIRSYSTVVLQELERRLLDWTFTSQLGDLFLQVADFMKAYTQYIQTYNKFRRTLSANRQSTQLSGLLDVSFPSVLIGMSPDVPELPFPLLTSVGLHSFRGEQNHRYLLDHAGSALTTLPDAAAGELSSVAKRRELRLTSRRRCSSTQQWRMWTTPQCHWPTRRFSM